MADSIPSASQLSSCLPCLPSLYFSTGRRTSSLGKAAEPVPTSGNILPVQLPDYVVVPVASRPTPTPYSSSLGDISYLHPNLLSRQVREETRDLWASFMYRVLRRTPKQNHTRPPLRFTRAVSPRVPRFARLSTSGRGHDYEYGAHPWRPLIFVTLLVSQRRRFPAICNIHLVRHVVHTTLPITSLVLLRSSRADAADGHRRPAL